MSHLSRRDPQGAIFLEHKPKNASSGHPALPARIPLRPLDPVFRGRSRNRGEESGDTGLTQGRRGGGGGGMPLALKPKGKNTCHHSIWVEG